MKHLLVLNVILVLALSACGGGSASTASPVAGSDATADADGKAPATSESSGAGENSNTTGSSSNTDPTPSPGTSEAPVAGECTFDTASFVSETVEDNSIFQPGQRFTKTWQVKNSGNCTWNDLYALVFVKGNHIDAPGPVALQNTIPGDMLEISVDLRAPSEEDVTRARADFEIHDGQGTAITIDGGTTLWVSIRVSDGSAPKGNTTVSNSGPGYADVNCAYRTDTARVSQLLEELNAYRAGHGAPPYILNDQLSEAAQAHAADMACNNLFYHNGSNKSTATSRVAASGYLASYVTENVYGSWPPLSPAEAIQWWATDASEPRHNENLLSTRYVEVGIGYAFFNNFGYYVIDFAVPQ